MLKKIKISGIGHDEMPVGAYCSPQPAEICKGIQYPSKITLAHYKLLADLGVNIVYGHAEAIGRADTEKYVFEALELCAQTGISYLVRDKISEEYVSLGHREYKDWRRLTDSQKADLNARFAASLSRYRDYKAFAGVSFYDEPGYDSFGGIAAAKAVFESECPDKLFYVNMLPNNIDARQLQYGACLTGVPDCNIDELTIKHSNADRYIYFLEKYMQTVKPQVFSYDSYPFLSLGNIQSMHHISLYELQQLAGWAEKKYGVPYWLFMQVGGRWEGSDTRATDYAEMLLQVNISLAYGAKGLQLFPACFPNDWLSDNVAEGGVIGRYGEITNQYHYLSLALKQVKACQKYLMNAELKGVVLSGAFNGLLPPESQLSKILWNETIFRGELPQFNDISGSSYGSLKSADASSQVFIGCFDYKGKELYYVVNNSIVTAVNVRLNFNREYTYKIIRAGAESSAAGCIAEVQRLAAGDGFLLISEEV